ncbi:alanyl (membrane) aminopeptidase-like b [Chanos chanos]|uniref:Aminopeptidase n=1 Tax=Chanos chanos TaxID=29144 RepID=A0A6J2UKA6_CHACN|nr:aminopeptidase N-like [Chanos chanos]
MAKAVRISKVLAIVTVVLTISAIGGIASMLAVYLIQIQKNPPTPPPTIVSTTAFPTGPPPTMRLPQNVFPVSYRIHLQPYLYAAPSNTTKQSFVFTGNSTVIIKCVETTKSIFLQSKDLNVTSVTVYDSISGDDLVESYQLHDGESNFLEIQLKDILYGNESFYEVFTAFEGELMDDLTGLYVSTYTEDDEQRFLAASQMQPTDARKVFPCFDEPAMKAEFNITVIHRDGTTALSNSQLYTEKYVEIDGDKWVVTEFHPTEKMSTYLLALTVSGFKSKQSPTDNRIKTWARPDAVDAGYADYAAETAAEVLKYYENLFKEKYPLAKLDQVAIPDFSAGAMENWGLVTYRETALLYEEGVSSTSDKEWITTVIAHELAHQWFGNLVTMKWWNDVWLNEGFATYFSYLGVDAVKPDWNVEDLLFIEDVQSALEVDSLNTSHPLSSPEADIDSPSEITELFDSITYSKGAAVLRMLSNHLGEEVFLNGIRNYLQEFKFRNAEYKDLWRCLQQAVDAANKHDKVEEMMRTWTEQVGYPVITINTITSEVSQQHFLLNQTTGHDLAWHVPVRLMKSGKPDILSDLLREKGPVPKPVYSTTGDEWLLANVNRTGYYRVNYNTENWNRLLLQLESDLEAIPPINRGQLIDDAFNLARAKLVNVTLALDTTKYLLNDTEYIPWESALQNLEYFILMFDRSEVYGPMQAYLQKQVLPLYDYYQNFTENASVPVSHTDQYNQINAVSVACSNGITKCIDLSKSLFQLWIDNDTNIIPANLKSTIYCSAIAAGEEEEWEFAWEKFQSATSATERDKLRYALSCTTKIWLLNRYLQYTLDPDKIKKMDAVSTINYIAKNVAGQSLAWDFVRAQWNYITQEYGAGIMHIGALIDGVTQRFSTDFELQQLKQFQKDNGAEFAYPDRALEQAIERTEANIKWVKENKDIVLDWFRRESQVL